MKGKISGMGRGLCGRRIIAIDIVITKIVRGVDIENITIMQQLKS